MTKPSMNLQDSFLNQVRRENCEIKILLVNGTVLRGNVKGFDNFTLILANRSGQHLVYKHAIAHIVSNKPLTGKNESLEELREPEPPVKEVQTKTPNSDPLLDNAPKEASKSTVKIDKKPGFNTLDLSNVQLKK